MSGDVANVGVWAGAETLVGGIAATNPATNAPFILNTYAGTPVTGQWDFIGLQDGSAGSTESQSNDSTDIPAWGKGVIITTRKNQALTRTITALEKNRVVLGLMYDTGGLTWTDEETYSGFLAQRDMSRKFKLAQDLVNNGTLKRRITAGYAMIDAIGDSTESEDAPDSVQFTFKIYPTATKRLWITYVGAAA